MNLNNKTVLITGGGSGIGLSIAKTLAEKGNQVIITGRNEEKLQKAIAGLQTITAFAGDINKVEDVDRLVGHLTANHPNLDVVINNAGQASAYHLGAEANAYEKANAEIDTNYLAVIRLNEKLLPLLSKQPESAIVNVTSIVVFAPNAFVSTYSASKAALHSYTQTLRYTLRDTAVKVFELFPPLVDTEFSAEIGGANGIPPSAVAEQFIAGLEADEPEIMVGRTADIYKLFLNSPQEAFHALNKMRGNE